MKGVDGIFSQILQAKVVAIIRGIRQNDLKPVLSALYEGGVTAIEVAMNSEAALDAVEFTRNEYSDSFTVGAGTVLDTATARSAILAGADFLLSPVLSESVVEVCHRYSKLPVPGVFSPSEVLEARRLGCPLVKIFPAAIPGPQYVSDLKGIAPETHLIPVGGITLENVSSFFSGGASAVGVGSQLVNPRWVAAGDFCRVTETARLFRLKANEEPSSL